MITKKQSDFEDLPKLSFYRYENFFNIHEDEYKNKYYNLLRSINIFPANDSSAEDEYLVESGDTWVYISYKFYNTIDLWWLICEYNQIKNPTQLPEVGKKIKVLKKELVWAVISEINNQLYR
jgi:hypothetical protein